MATKVVDPPTSQQTEMSPQLDWIGWIVMKYDTHIRGPQRTNPDHFLDPTTFPL